MDAGVRIATRREGVLLPCSRSREAWWFFMALGFCRGRPWNLGVRQSRLLHLTTTAPFGSIAPWSGFRTTRSGETTYRHRFPVVTPGDIDIACSAVERA
jgi:hypothetical protein